jgi:hypothetical protein
MNKNVGGKPSPTSSALPHLLWSVAKVNRKAVYHKTPKGLDAVRRQVLRFPLLRGLRPRNAPIARTKLLRNFFNLPSSMAAYFRITGLMPHKPLWYVPCYCPVSGAQKVRPYSPQRPVSGFRAASVPCRLSGAAQAATFPCHLFLPVVGRDFGKKSSPFCPSGRGIFHSLVGAFFGSVSHSAFVPQYGMVGGWMVFPRLGWALGGSGVAPIGVHLRF